MKSASKFVSKSEFKGPGILFKPLIFIKNTDYLFITPYKVIDFP